MGVSVSLNWRQRVLGILAWLTVVVAMASATWLWQKPQFPNDHIRNFRFSVLWQRLLRSLNPCTNDVKFTHWLGRFRLVFCQHHDVSGNECREGCREWREPPEHQVPHEASRTKPDWPKKPGKFLWARWWYMVASISENVGRRMFPWAQLAQIKSWVYWDVSRHV